MLLLALSTHCAYAGSSGHIALLLTTLDPNAYSVKPAPPSCVISDYSRIGSQGFHSVDQVGFPKDKWVSLLKSYGSKRWMILVVENADETSRYYSPLDLNDQGRLVQSPKMTKFDKSGLQASFASERYIIGSDDDDRSVSTIQQDKSGDLRIVSTSKLLSLNEPVSESVILDAEPIGISGEFIVSESFLTAESACRSVLHMLHTNSDGVIHESSRDNLRLNGMSKIVSDFSRNLIYVLTFESPFSFGLSKIHQYRIQPNGKPLEINLKDSAFGDSIHEAAGPVDSQDLKKVFPAPPVVYHLNPIAVQSLKLCSRRNFLFGFGGVGMNEIYVWSVGKNGISHLLTRYHIENDSLLRGATQAANNQNQMPGLIDLNSYLDNNEDNLYVTREDDSNQSQKVYKFKISDDGQLTSLPLDIPLEANRMISGMEFIQYK